jgi:chemotaxis protein methyltransferase CheR
MKRSLPAALLANVSELVVSAIGLHFPPERFGDLERGLISAAGERGRDPERYAGELLSASLTRSELELLASHLTIGETYFFREKGSLDIFAQEIVPALLQARDDGDRRIRIWSAGCCSGEEPYSLAMILSDMIPDRAAWDVTILATDINPRFLAKAAAGIYGEWSFRETPVAVRERYFTKRGRNYEVHPRIRERVKFSSLNLASDAYPSLLNDTDAMDVIFCRNVLMYFPEERVKQVARNFHRSLAPGGWLIVGAAEASNGWFSPFAAVQRSGATLYRKNGAPEAAFPSPFPYVETSFSFPPEPADLVPEAPPPPVVAECETAREEQRESQPDPVAEARRSANEGRLLEAEVWCERAISADRMSPSRHYLFASVQQEMGKRDAAEQSLQRALYLDHDFVLAHFALANLELSRHRGRDARRHFANAEFALRSHAREEVLPESDGLTAGRLAEIITSVLATLPPDEIVNAGRSTLP